MILWSRMWITAARIAALVLAATTMASPSFSGGPQQPRQCLVLGDSLAQGVSIYAPQCEARTRVGINSQAFANLYPQAGVAWSALISLGANDLPGSATIQSVAAVRLSINSRHVVWLMPARPDSSRAAISMVAGAFGDQRIDTRAAVSGDGLHLSGEGYRAIAMLAGLRPIQER